MFSARYIPVLATIAVLATASGCQSSSTADRNQPGAPVNLSDADKAAIEAADQAFEAAVKAGNIDGITAIYMEDATLLPPNLPAQKGRNAIRDLWGGLLKEYAVQIESGSDALEGRGDLAYHVGHFRMQGTPKAKGGHRFTDEGKFLEVLKKQADGSWKYVADMYSSNLPAQH